MRLRGSGGDGGRGVIAGGDGDEFVQVRKLIGADTAVEGVTVAVDGELNQGSFAESDEVGLMNVECDGLMLDGVAVGIGR